MALSVVAKHAKALATMLAGVLLAILVSGASADTRAAAKFEPVRCPDSLTRSAECQLARDDLGAFVMVAMPKQWNRRLVVHAHGGPRLSPPKPEHASEDLDRFAVMVREGYAWVGSTYRRSGYGVRMAAADVERSRRLFVSQWGQPARTLLHGQSWGGNVAARLAELHVLDADGRSRYDAMLTTNGVLSGGTRAYTFRADLRAIYQYFCRNHPAADEVAYPLWQGLPAGSRMTRESLEDRVAECTGIGKPPAARSAEEAARLHDILAVSGVAETQLLAHLAWGTFHFQDLVRRLGGANPFDNSRTRYQGSRDDAALNQGIERFAADRTAVARLAYDADLSGLIILPTLTVHALHDPVVSATAQDHYARVVQAAGRGHLLAQVRTDESNHSRLSDATVRTALGALEAWLDGGPPPDGRSLQRVCEASASERAACRFLSARPGDPDVP
jgi:alpha-beta hydrolase superfamily lysophospholipase